MEAQVRNGSDNQGEAFKESMSKRLEETQLESKRHFENYLSVRNQLNELVQEKLSQLPS
jgi:hypothetical protein